MIRRTYIFLLLSILPGISLGQDLKLRVVDQENKPLFGYAVSPQNRYRQDVLTDENGIAVLDNSLRGLPVEVSGYNTKHKTVVLDGDFTTVVMDVTSEVFPWDMAIRCAKENGLRPSRLFRAMISSVR